ncbi:MAG: S41 family peptidase [Patescibacteria group bacterium]|jgi:carboxyl-terminal processing protease
MELNQNQTEKTKSKFNSRLIKVYSLIVLIVLIFSAGFIFGRFQLSQKAKVEGGTVKHTQEIPDFLTKDVNFSEFWQVWNYVKDNYVKSDVPESQLFYGAMAGIVASLGDPYSVFLNPEISNKFEEELAGSFEGIGAEIGIKQDRLTIIAPLPGTPADKAGLRAGDKILAIDGADTAGIALDYAVSIIRGNKGTQVKLTVLSNGDEEPKEVSITREKIEIDSVKFSRKSTEPTPAGEDKSFELKEGNIAYIELLYFNENTLADWNKTIQEVLAAGPKGIILDLRNNPGGFLNTAIEVAGEWVDSEVVVYEQLRNGTKIAHQANRLARLKDIPTVVLVNKGSASGSEIVAGALQDYKVATLVGETTFGKGSVQDLKKFSDGSSVKLTIAEWLTPNGRNINEEGIKPDIEIELTTEDYNSDKDPQLDKALQILKTTE